MPNNIGFGVQAKGVAKASNDLDRLRDKFDKLGKTGGKGFAIGAAAGATTFALGAMSQAVSMATDVIGDSIKAAREDQASIQQLGTALRANVPAWDGNTDAIEKTLKARMKLGFSDDEQRSSLATLAAATHNVTKGLDLERGAMDISRARHIDLASASDAVAKAYAGNTKGLKSMLPGLKLGATSAETLANAFAMVKGQADDFAKTDEGKVLVAQTKVNEAMETFGYMILPGATQAMVGAADAVVGLVSSLEFLQKGLAKTTDGQKEQVQGAIDLTRAFGFLIPGLETLGKAEQAALDHTNAVTAAQAAAGDMSGSMSRAAYTASQSMQGSFGNITTSADEFRDKFHDDAGDVIRASNRMRSQLVKDAAIIRGDVFDETEIRADLFDKHLSLLAAAEQKRTAKTAEARRQARDDVVQALDDEGQALEDLAAKGALTSKDVEGFAKDAKANYRSLSKEGRKHIDELIARYKALAAQPNIHKTFTLSAPGLHGVVQDYQSLSGRGEPKKKQARGGPGGGVTLVGEEGPEIVDLPTGSYVHTAQESKRMMQPGGSSMSGGLTLVVNPPATWSPAAARAFADATGPAIYDYLYRRGAVSRS